MLHGCDESSGTRQIHRFGAGRAVHGTANRACVVSATHEGAHPVRRQLSRFAQYVELDLRAFAGKVPLDMIGRVRFPPIGELPYLLTFAPHGFYWFLLTDGAQSDV